MVKAITLYGKKVKIKVKAQKTSEIREILAQIIVNRMENNYGPYKILLGFS